MCKCEERPSIKSFNVPGQYLNKMKPGVRSQDINGIIEKGAFLLGVIGKDNIYAKKPPLKLIKPQKVTKNAKSKK